MALRFWSPAGVGAQMAHWYPLVKAQGLLNPMNTLIGSLELKTHKLKPGYSLISVDRTMMITSHKLTFGRMQKKLFNTENVLA